jgi:hypothetical protein
MRGRHPDGPAFGRISGLAPARWSNLGPVSSAACPFLSAEAPAVPAAGAAEGRPVTVAIRWPCRVIALHSCIALLLSKFSVIGSGVWDSRVGLSLLSAFSHSAPHWVLAARCPAVLAWTVPAASPGDVGRFREL